MRHEQKEQAVLQNLKDAGCDHQTITAFIADYQENRTAEAMKILRIHRRTLLENLHKGQKQIDCLDYLVYRLEKERNIKNNADERRDRHERDQQSDI